MTKATPRAQQAELRLRITVVDPPAGVAFAMQRGRSELAPAVETRADALVFEFSVNVGRIKVPLYSMTPALVAAAIAAPGTVLAPWAPASQ